ncbi:MAG: DUF5719 family protein [Microbacteriaceae bacterium]
MSNRSKLVRGSAQVGTGIAVTAVGALLIMLAGQANLPTVKHEVPSQTVNTATTTNTSIVCQGSFGVLGLNASSPNDVTPIGEAETKVSGSETTKSDLALQLSGATPPSSHTVPGSEDFRAAQQQRIDTETVRGLAASSCGEATNEQWIVGGSTARGISSVITLSNPGAVAATVTIGVFNEEGPVEGVGTTGVLVPPATTKTVPLSGFGAGYDSTAIRVQASGSPVFATLGVHQITDITPIGADTVNAQLTPSTELVFSGVRTYENHTHGEEGEDGHDAALARLLSPEVATKAKVFSLTADKERALIGEVDLEAGVVTDLGLSKLPKEATGVIVESDEPIVGGVMALLHNNNEHDFAWMTPSSVFPSGETVKALTLPGGTLTLTNVSDKKAEFTVGESTVTLEPYTAKQIAKAGEATVQGEAPFALGVTLFDEHTLSTYPVLASASLIEEFTVYTR